MNVTLEKWRKVCEAAGIKLGSDRTEISDHFTENVKVETPTQQDHCNTLHNNGQGVEK